MSIAFILVNFYYTAENTADVVEQGMLVFYTDPGKADIAKADDAYVSSCVETSGLYIATTDGIAAKEMGDDRYYCAYAKLSDGSYAYSMLYQYSPKKYAMNMLGKASTSEKQKALCVAMLNYGAAAQEYFGYNTDSLVNAELTAEQQALVGAYDASLFVGAVGAEPNKIAGFAATANGFSQKSATVSFDAAFSINYYFTISQMPDGPVTFYYWSPADYKNATALSPRNASGSIVMEDSGDGRYWAQISGIAAKELDKTYYVAVVYYSDLQLRSTGVIAYSLSKYCISKAVDGNAVQELAAATAMYGYYAKAYFG